MHELLGTLTLGQRVLDLGSRTGSFRKSATQATVVRMDRDAAPASAFGAEWFIQGDAAAIPFAIASLDLVVANHSLEHFERLDHCLEEIGRVLKPEGHLFVTVPDASTFTDVVYRWLAKGGGHINAFTDSRILAARISERTGRECTCVRRLYSGLSFLHRNNLGSRPPRKICLLGGGSPLVLRYLSLGLRLSDSIFGTGLSRYGWAMYFGPPLDASTAADHNVCIRCGSGHPTGALRARRRIGFILARYDCPTCGETNIFTEREPVIGYWRWCCRTAWARMVQ